MSQIINVYRFGTPQAPETLETVTLGGLSFFYSVEGIRRICWQGQELIRAVTWPIRDENWGTYTPIVLENSVLFGDDTFNATLGLDIGDKRLTCRLTIKASNDGILTLQMDMIPVSAPFETNRAGFTVLHPISNLAGSPLEVEHTDGTREITVFPRAISPGQPVFDIARLRYGVGEQSADIQFVGETFEMEDQRNWSDASYKTYCVPLIAPFTYSIARPVRQEIRIALSGPVSVGSAASQSPSVTWQHSDQLAPSIGLVVDQDWPFDADIIRQSGVDHLRARFDARHSTLTLPQLDTDIDLDVELVLKDDFLPETALTEAKRTMALAGWNPDRLIALPAAYLDSHQPCGPWPTGASPDQVAKAAQIAFPDTQIGVGMLTNFTEFNRCPPPKNLGHFYTHAGSAIVHAGDDLSVIETLESLPQIFHSAQRLAATPQDDTAPSLPSSATDQHNPQQPRQRHYRLGLMSIGLRTNPYGADVAPNPNQIRCTLACEDPRQRGLFAAAWAVGVLAATSGSDVQSLCLGAPCGPFGISHTPQKYRQPYFDDIPSARLFPLFHIVRYAATMSDRTRLIPNQLPPGVAFYGIHDTIGTRLMVANISAHNVTFSFHSPASLTILDSHTFPDAASNPTWVDDTLKDNQVTVQLEPYAIAFAKTK